MVKFTIKVSKGGKKEIKLRIDEKKMDKTITDSMNYQSRLLTDYIQRNHLRGGTTKTKLAVRTGHLRSTTFPIIARKRSGFIIGGTKFGAKYAPIHVGERGTETEIRVKNPDLKYLAIPLPPAKSKGGSKKLVKTRDFPDMEFRQKKGRDPVMGYSTGRGGFVPYFALKKSVKIKRRVFPDAIINAQKNKLARGIKKDVDILLEKEL
jgi:hypothetical protein